MNRKRKLRRSQRTPSINGASDVSTTSSSSLRSPHNKTDETSTRLSKRLRQKQASKKKQLINKYRPIDILPNDTLAKILFGGFLDKSPMQLATISCVCKRFKLVADSSQVSLNLRKVKLPLLKQVIDRYTNLCHLDFSNRREFGDRQLQLLMPVREKLQSLKLRGTNITDRSIGPFFDSATRDRNGSLVYDMIFRLEILDLSWTAISHESGVNIAISCPRLKSLKLSGCKGIDDANMAWVFSHMTNLQALDVSMCPITFTGCWHLSRSKSLREVDISACPELSLAALRFLITGKVEALNETELLRRTNTGTVSQLRSISAQYMDELDSSLLDEMAVCAPHLRRLDLRHYQNIDNTDLSSFKISIQKLQKNGVQVAFSSTRSN